MGAYEPDEGLVRRVADLDHQPENRDSSHIANSRCQVAATVSASDTPAARLRPDLADDAELYFCEPYIE
jgi:hypothetical protein